jgi:hypothetical protein
MRPKTHARKYAKTLETPALKRLDDPRCDKNHDEHVRDDYPAKNAAGRLIGWQ